MAAMMARFVFLFRGDAAAQFSPAPARRLPLTLARSLSSPCDRARRPRNLLQSHRSVLLPPSHPSSSCPDRPRLLGLIRFSFAFFASMLFFVLLLYNDCSSSCPSLCVAWEHAAWSGRQLYFHTLPAHLSQRNTSRPRCLFCERGCAFAIATDQKCCSIAFN